MRHRLAASARWVSVSLLPRLVVEPRPAERVAPLEEVSGEAAVPVVAQATLPASLAPASGWGPE